jgi:hypothetical protein
VAADEPDVLFERLVRRFGADPRVTLPSPGKERKFGDAGLKVGGKIFAMISKGQLVLKLPRERVEELVASAKGKRFDPGHGRLMKEWVTISPRDGARWEELAEEALQFVAGGSTPTP